MPTTAEAKKLLKDKLPEQYKQEEEKEEPKFELQADLDPHELELAKKRELLKEAKVLRERRRQTFGEVRNQDPNKAYIWARLDTQNLSRKRGLGYEIVVSGKNSKVETDFVQGNGEHRRGDTILVQCDKDLHEAHKILPQIEALERVEGKYDEFMGWAEASGVPARVTEKE